MTYISSEEVCFWDLISDDVFVQVPPAGKGTLYIRPLLMGSGPILGLGPAPEYTFIVYASPVGNYFKVYTILLHVHAFWRWND